MKQIEPFPIGAGHAGEGHSFREMFEKGIRAVVQLAIEERPLAPPRDLIYCRIPLLDGSGNEPLLLSLAINLVANLLRMGIPTLVCCGAGMSRSPAVVAAALARARQGNPDECLKMVTHSGSRDVSAALWEDIIRLMKKEM